MALISNIILAPDTRANQPAATAVPPGSLYFVTDEAVLERSNGTAWETFGGAGLDLQALTFLTSGDETGVLAASRQLIAGSNITLDATVGGDLTISSSAGGSSVPDFLTRTVNAWYPAFVSGIPNDAVIGTTIALAEAGNQSAVVASGHLVLNYASSATAGNIARFRSSQMLLVRPDLNPDLTVVMRTPSDMTDVRLWVGFVSTPNTDADTLGGHGASFRYSTVAGDSGWTPVTRDGTTQNVGSAIGSTPAADTIFRLRIRTIDDGVTWKFSVNGGAEQDVTTNVPGSTTGLGHDQTVIPQINSSRNIGMVRVQLAFGAEIS